ncbi:MAG: peptide chain release factor N(5)-glutamine methyltransferase [Acidobacteriota bacterium]|nr:peptide chain release factor N(5)-glutamine methyltransferase [Acidobacteriota bacterium]
MTLQAYLRDAQLRLEASGIAGPEATRDADLLARHALGWDRATLIARKVEVAPTGFSDAYAALIVRRARREPIAYIRGVQEFWGRDFLVRHGVLIPRPESELIIEEALRWAGGRTAGTPLPVLDIGTGSGCLAVTLALELPGASVSATDVSVDALEVARENAGRLGAGVSLHAGSCVADAAGPFELVVSNPPYVTAAEHRALQPEVRDHEPTAALVGGVDGLGVVREVIQGAAEVLAPAGLLLVEIGLGQADAAARIVADTEGLTLLRIRPDLQGIPRVVVAERTAISSESAASDPGGSGWDPSTDPCSR